MNGIMETKKVINVQNENGVEKQFEIASQHSPQQSYFIYIYTSQHLQQPRQQSSHPLQT
jgi:hypothetical protein